MQILVIVIEKDGDHYIGRSPNLLGISVTANSREQVEKEILEAIEKRIAELREQYSIGISVTTEPIEMAIPCIAKTYEQWGGRETCLQKARKDGLCWQHWKKRFGHAFGTKVDLRACPLCGETDMEELKRWDSPCPYKFENSNWPDVLEEKKVEMREIWKQERKELALEQLGNKPRCSRILSNGEQCLKEAHMNGICFTHDFRDRWNLRETRTTSPSRYDPDENARNYFKYRNLR